MKINTFIIPIIRSDFIERMLFTLYRYTQKDSFNVIVIDQTTTKEAQEKCENYSHLWIRPYRNLGFAKAMNTGIRLADTKFITLANDDIEFMNKKWWDGIVSAFADDQKIIAVNPMSPKEATWGYGHRADNHDTWEPKTGFTAVDNKEGMVPVFDGKPFLYQESYSDEEYDTLLNRHPSWAKNSACDAIAMWCTVFKKTGLDEIGLLEERFYPGGGEDYDMNARAYSCAYPNEREVCDPDFHRRMIGTSKSWVWHHWGKSREISQATPTAKIFASRERWNANEELWAPSFDVWGHYDKDGIKKPIHRTKTPLIDEL